LELVLLAVFGDIRSKPQAADAAFHNAAANLLDGVGIRSHLINRSRCHSKGTAKWLLLETVFLVRKA